MLEDLGQRLRDLDDIAGKRRPSMWQHSNSAGSVHSSNGGSVGYSSPQSLPPGPAAYRQGSVTAYNMTSYSEPGHTPQTSPPLYHHQPNPFPQQPMQPYEQQQPYDQQQHYFQQSAGQPFSFGEQQSMSQYPAYPTQGRPSQQFASWGGYSGRSVPDTLDEENAVDPTSNPWNLENK